MKELKNIFFIAVGCAAAIDVIVSINFNWNITQELKNFYNDYDKREATLQDIRNYDNSPFYRIENVTNMTLNDPSWYGYYGVSTFSSMAYESMAKLQHRLGIPGNHINSYYYVQTTPVYDMMFDIKYFIGNSNDKTRYSEIESTEEITNQFDYNVGLSYGVNEELRNWDYDTYDPFTIQNDYIEKSTGVKDVFSKMFPESSQEKYDDGVQSITKYEYKNTNDNMYFYTENYAIDFIVIGDCLYYRNDNYVNYIENVSDEIHYTVLDSYNEAAIINIKSSDETIPIYIGYNSFAFNSYYMYAINQKKFEEAYKILNDNKMNITKFSEKEIEGTIYTDKKMVYTSIPYDEGWKVYIDDKQVDTFKIGDSLLAYNIEPGTHKVVYKYEAKGFKIGLLGTIVGILLLIINKPISLIKKKLSTKKKDKKKNNKKKHK